MGLMEAWKIINFWRTELEEAGRNHPLEEFLAMCEDRITASDAEAGYQCGRAWLERGVLLHEHS